MKNIKNEGIDDFDVSDAPEERPERGPRRPPPVPVRTQRPSGPPRRLPGANKAPFVRGPKREATPFAPQTRRPRSDTLPMPVSNEQMFNVEVPGVATYKVPASDARAAALRIDAYLRSGEDKEIGRKNFDPNQFKVTLARPDESSTAGGSLTGHQSPTDDTYEARLREAVRTMVRDRLSEIVRKKEGGGGYVLYGPNKGKKKQAKPSGEFPTRLAAKRAELARFPPKDPEQLKRARKRLDKLLKDPKKRAEAERADLAGRKVPKKKGAPARARKKAAREAFIRGMARDLRERLFREDEIPGSPWDERIASLTPDAIASDKTLARHHKNIQSASSWSLGDAHKTLAKVLRGMAKVNPGDVAHDPERRKTFMPVMLDCDGVEIGPVHLYIDGGHVKVEVSQDARAAIGELDPDYARDLRGGLMSFQEDHLPKIDYARKAWEDRDSYLDKLHGKLEKHAGGLSGVEHHLLRQLLGKGGRKR